MVIERVSSLVSRVAQLFVRRVAVFVEEVANHEAGRIGDRVELFEVILERGDTRARKEIVPKPSLAGGHCRLLLGIVIVPVLSAFVCGHGEEYAPRPHPDAPLSEYLVYVMSAYSAHNLQRALDESAEQVDLSQLYPPDALFDPDVHETMEAAIRQLCSEIRETMNTRAFIATDVGIPTITQVQDEG